VSGASWWQHRWEGQEHGWHGEFESGKESIEAVPAEAPAVPEVAGTNLDPAPEGRDVTDTNTADAVLAAGAKDSLIGDLGHFDAEDGKVVFSEAEAKLAKGEVSSNLADHITSSTGDLMLAAGYSQGMIDSYLKLSGSLDSIPGATLRNNATSMMIAGWASTSNDSDKTSLAMQESAAKEFGLTNTMGWNTFTTAVHTAAPAEHAVTVQDKVDSILAQSGQTQQDFLRAQYDATQQLFKDNGVATITLYRGQSAPPVSPNGWTQLPRERYSGVLLQHADSVQMRPMSSWSSSAPAAAVFTGRYDNADAPVLMTAQVPVNQILSTPRTGFGCLNEHEFVVLGNVQDVKVQDLSNEKPYN
jgi:hypothetical protein